MTGPAPGGATGAVVMVDVYAPTLRLARAFAGAGRPVVRVQSTPKAPPVYAAGFDRRLFADEIVHLGDFDATLAAVAGHNPQVVITGGELGVELADRLSEALGVATNGTRLSAVRRHKFLQVEVVREAGLATTPQVLADGEHHLAAWHAQVGGTLVIKPARSAGNDGVAFCRTTDQALAAYRKIRDQANIFGEINRQVVAQQLISGTEFAVNTVSCRGRHRVTDLWRYAKIAANGVSNRVAGGLFVPPGDPARPVLQEYAFAVLDALEVAYGPAHLEIILGRDGPCLVEIGARLCGADAARWAQVAGGESQIEWTVDAYLAPERFLAHHRRPPEIRRHVAMGWFTSPAAGVLRGYPRLDLVLGLESFCDLQTAVEPGGQLAVTVSDTTEPLGVTLAHSDPEVVARDFNTLLWLDGPGFYEVERSAGGRGVCA